MKRSYEHHLFCVIKKLKYNIFKPALMVIMTYRLKFHEVVTREDIIRYDNVGSIVKMKYNRQSLMRHDLRRGETEVDNVVKIMYVAGKRGRGLS